MAGEAQEPAATGPRPLGLPLPGLTAWRPRPETPLRQFLHTETGSAAVLLAATVAALIWVNSHAASYEAVWRTHLAVTLGGHGVSDDLGGWVNSGLMTLFFLVMGLEARREFDMGELRARHRIALPVLAGIGGILVPVAIYLAFNAGRSSAHGWGTAMSTDSAFALGMLALVGPRLPDRVRTYLLTFSVVDDTIGIVIIAVVYSGHVDLAPLLAGLVLLTAVLALRLARIRSGLVYVLFGVAAWVAVFKSGVDPVVVGLIIGVLTYAHPAARTDLERASELFRLFREQPTPELAADAREGVRTAVSPNDRLQQLFHPWVSYLIVPLFALANAGIVVSGSFLAHAFTSPITLGILAGYVVGKPVGTTGAAWLVAKISRGRISPPVGWGAVGGAGSIAGIGFTVSLLIASLAFHGEQLAEAKAGVLAAALCAAALTWLVSRAIMLLPKRLRVRALLGTSETIIDLAVPVDPERDHIRGPKKSPVTVVEYGDFECPYCGQAEPVIRELLADRGDVRYVWRHLPLPDVHPWAEFAAEGAEAAAQQGEEAFWGMHDLLLEHQDELRQSHLLRYAAQLGLDTEKFAKDLKKHVGADRVAEDVDSADLSSVAGTPTFFINGKRFHGAFDLGTLSDAVSQAHVRAVISSAR